MNHFSPRNGETPENPELPGNGSLTHPSMQVCNRYLSETYAMVFWTTIFLRAAAALKAGLRCGLFFLRPSCFRSPSGDLHLAPTREAVGAGAAPFLAAHLAEHGHDAAEFVGRRLRRCFLRCLACSYVAYEFCQHNCVTWSHSPPRLRRSFTRSWLRHASV